MHVRGATFDMGVASCFCSETCLLVCAVNKHSPSGYFFAEVTGKEIQSPFRVEATVDPRAPCQYPADPHQPPGSAHPPAQSQQEGLPPHTRGQPAGPSRKRPKSASPAPGLAASQVCSHSTNLLSCLQLCLSKPSSSVLYRLKAEAALLCYVILLLHGSRLSHAYACCHRYLCLLLVLQPAEQCESLQAGMCGYLETDMLTTNQPLCPACTRYHAVCMDLEAVTRVYMYLHRGSPALTVVLSWTNARAFLHVQEPGGPSGPAPVTAEELEAIMKLSLIHI